MIDHHSQAYTDLILGWLGCKDVSEISQCTSIDTALDLFKNDPSVDQEEPWELPKDFEVLLQTDNLVGEGMSYGFIAFGLYRGVRVIAECNASPFLFYWKNR